MAMFAKGTPSSVKGMEHWTTEQLMALEEMKDPRTVLGTAKPEFLGKLLWPDGTVSDDASVMAALALAKAQGLALASDGTEESIREALRYSQMAKEVEAMRAENRFLFVVDSDGLPVVYFQCAVPGNPDVEWRTE